MRKFHQSMNKNFASMIVVLFGFAGLTQACIWDAKTLWAEKHDHPTLAQAILHPKTEKPDTNSLLQDLAKFKAAPNTNDPMWWNNLAGTYLRLGQPQEAVRILEPLTNRFPNDYGVHANLGTAYHLLGRYAEAEREIRRDTEINTNAHFGLEKYHLALLQYLCRDEKYRFRHLYVDEFSLPFVIGPPRIDVALRAYANPPSNENQTNSEGPSPLEIKLDKFMRTYPGEPLNGDLVWSLQNLITDDAPPPYRQKWDLSSDPKLDDGVIYMATLNPQQPACWTMLGTLGLYHRDYHLAKVAFEKAITLGSIQTPILKLQLQRIEQQISNTRRVDAPTIFLLGGVILICLIGCYWLFRCLRKGSAKI